MTLACLNVISYKQHAMALDFCFKGVTISAIRNPQSADSSQSLFRAAALPQSNSAKFISRSQHAILPASTGRVVSCSCTQ